MPYNVELGLFGFVCMCVWVGALFMSFPISVPVVIWRKNWQLSRWFTDFFTGTFASSLIWAFICIGACLSYVLSMPLSFSYGLFEETGSSSKTHSVVSTDRSSSCEGLGALKHGKPQEWRSKCLGGFVM